jgi:hypothetical protein
MFSLFSSFKNTSIHQSTKTDVLIDLDSDDLQVITSIRIVFDMRLRLVVLRPRDSSAVDSDNQLK